MAMSGVSVDDQCVQMWELLKQRKIKGCNFMLTKDMKKIVVEENTVIGRNPREATQASWFESWTQSLPENACRYAIYDVEVGLDLGGGMSTGSRNKLVFCVWAPMTAKIKDKMVTASSKDGLKKKFDGIQVEWQLNSAEELEASQLIESLMNSPDIKTSGKITHFEGLPVGDW